MLVVLAVASAATAFAARGERRVHNRIAEVPFTRTLMSAAESGTDTSSRMQVVVIAQRRDCEGNLSFASYFNRVRVRDGVVVRQLLIEGAAADTLGLRARLPAVLRTAGMSLLAPRERETLRVMGHDATPIFLLLDSDNRIIAAVPVDPDPVHRTAFLRAITHLVNYDPNS